MKLDRIEGILGLLESEGITSGRSPTVGYDRTRARTTRTMTPSPSRGVEGQGSVIEIKFVLRYESIGRVSPVRTPRV